MRKGGGEKRVRGGGIISGKRCKLKKITDLLITGKREEGGPQPKLN